MEVTQYGNPKQNYWKRVFSLFYVKKTKKNGWKPTNFQEIEKYYQKGIFWVFMSLLPKKKTRENWCKALYIEKESDIARKVYNECFIVQNDNKAKNAKTRIYGEVS